MEGLVFSRGWIGGVMVNALTPQSGVPAFDPRGVTHEQIILYCTAWSISQPRILELEVARPRRKTADNYSLCKHLRTLPLAY